MKVPLEKEWVAGVSFAVEEQVQCAKDVALPDVILSKDQLERRAAFILSLARVHSDSMVVL